MPRLPAQVVCSCTNATLCVGEQHKTTTRRQILTHPFLASHSPEFSCT